MQDEKLKELIQAVLDGKELQWDYHRQTGWQSYHTNRAICYRIQRLCEDCDKYVFQIKPEVKTFKYKTRPCRWKNSTGKENFGLWSNTNSSNFATERELEVYCEHSYFDMNFKWLAPVTEHEVEYE